MAKLTVLMGAPGAGKSTYATGKGEVVTTDAARTNGAAGGDVLHSAYKQINQLLSQGKDVVFDTTALNPNVRKAAVGIAQKYGARVDMHVLDTPVDTCVKAQKGRTNPVSESTVRDMHAAIRRQIPGLKKEGFKSITITRDRK